MHPHVQTCANMIRTSGSQYEFGSRMDIEKKVATPQELTAAPCAFGGHNDLHQGGRDQRSRSDRQRR